MFIHKRYFQILMAIFAAIIFTMSFAGSAAQKSQPTGSSSSAQKALGAGSTWEISETTYLTGLTITEGAAIKAPAGYMLTMTVDGVETGQKLVDLKAADGATHFIPGSYKGNIVLSVTKPNPTRSFNLRQALYLDQTGVVPEKSVLAAVTGKRPAGFDISDITINSTGECFNGIYVAGGQYTLKNVRINFTGDGRSDFEGYGAAIMATGEGTMLVVDNSKVWNKGIVRTGVIAAGGSNVIVKNSTIETHDGEKPPYVLSQRGGSGLGGSIGLCRATIVLGTNTRASYINSTVTGDGWGLLASDDSRDIKMAAINSTISHTADIGGYGAYALGNATEWFLGTELNVSTTGVTLKDGQVFYGDSTPAKVADLNEKLELGLTTSELKAIPNVPGG